MIKVNTVSYLSGDTNSDNILQTTEAWVYKTTYAIMPEDINRDFVKKYSIC
jgi:hypothetical protein